MKKIIITVEEISLTATLNDSDTAEKIYKALPFEGIANTWGDEVYFNIPVSLDQEPDARADVEVGELGYWPVGSAFCIFFGPTPVSKDEKPRAASPVNIFGKVDGDVKVLKQVPGGATVKVDK
ncbi:MAG: hypothetical protein JSV22_07155 [Bacteroidales bacterium]|nr:MAG: hypothetical protein JSV22_07155 [Bacteroidales bacterium]